ncbi:hypothetical protein DXG01_001194 [Tephrocybe rancida]|nr:hypothetical protein DXG01_001194 [Tephrocybe rancida]
MVRSWRLLPSFFNTVNHWERYDEFEDLFIQSRRDGDVSQHPRGVLDDRDVYRREVLILEPSSFGVIPGEAIEPLWMCFLNDFLSLLRVPPA